MDTHSDVVVVGAGVIGSAVAYRLGQAGLSVNVVERGLPGGGTSGSTFAWLNSLGKAPREYHVLNLRSIGEHRALAEEVGSHECLHLTGSFAWVSAPSAVSGTGDRRGSELEWVEESRRLAQRIDVARSYGYHVEEVDREDLKATEPDLAVPETIIGRVYYMPGEGWLDAQGTAHRLLRAAMQRYRVRLLLHTRIVHITPAAEARHAALMTDGGIELRTDLIVNCAGPSARRVAELAGATVPVQQVPGIVFATDAQPVAIRHVLQDFRVLSLRPEGTSRVLMHCARLDSKVLDGAPLTRSAAEALEAEVRSTAAELLPTLAFAGFSSARIGVRPVPEDGVAIVGFDSKVPRLYHVVTHSGVTLSALLSRLVADDILGGGSPELEPFRPGRFDRDHGD